MFVNTPIAGIVVVHFCWVVEEVVAFPEPLRIDGVVVFDIAGTVDIAVVVDIDDIAVLGRVLVASALLQNNRAAAEAYYVIDTVELHGELRETDHF